MIRTFYLQAHLNKGARVLIVTDASPWGLGGLIMYNDVTLAYFMDAITETDQRILKVKTGVSEGQQ